MTEGTEKETLITLGFSGTEKKFTNIDELREFLQTQQNDWAWVEQAAREDGNLAQVWYPFDSYFKRVDRFISEHEAYSGQRETQAELINNFRSENQDLVEQGVILAEDPRAHFLSMLKDKESPQVAGYALALLNDISIVLNTTVAYKGAYFATQYLSNPTGDFSEMLQKTFDSIVKEQITKQTRNFEKQTATQKNSFENQAVKQVSNSEKQITKQAADFEIMLNEANRKLTDFETTFKEDIALQSSVAYWTKKRKHHQKVMWWMATFTVISAAVTALGFIWAANEHLDVTIDEVKLAQIGVMLAISTLGVWLTRLAAKIFISNLHLRTDADERVTMIQTYLAFLAEGKGPKDDERQLILQTLFRSSTTGFIKDDGPTTPLETLATKATGKKG